METIGRYRLLKRLASGGMGEVYLATQTGAQGFQKFVALKRVAAIAASDPELISLFLDEARLVATLSHRSIVQVYDLGQDEAGFFVAMEFVQGPSVRALLDRLASQGQRLPPAIALDIAAQVGDALACAYYSRAPDGTPLRIIHRDVSPRNVLVSISGDVKLIDFGIAQSMRQIGTSGLTGKLAYMSPEQLRNEPLNARSDLFSLGIVLCEMLGGQNPFARNDPKEMVVAIQREEPTLPSARDPGLAPCDPVLKRLLAKLPSERFADGIELAEALAELRAHFPKPPKRLSAVVSDLFGLEIAELLRVAHGGPATARTEPAARPPPGLATPPRPVVKDAGLGTDSSPNHANTPSIYHRVTQPYLKLSSEREETQPNLAVPKIVRSEPVGEPGATTQTTETEPTAEADKTRPETVPPAPTPVEADSGDVVALREISTPMPGLRTALDLPPAPMPIDLPELQELQGEKTGEGSATETAPAPGAQPPAASATPAAAAPAENELPAGAVQVPAPEGAPGDDSSWYKVSIPPGKAPPTGATPTTAPPGQFDESSWFLVSIPPKTRAAAAPASPAPTEAPAAQPLPATKPAIEIPSAAELAAEAQTTLPSTPDALVRARAVAASFLPATTAETTMPGAQHPARNFSLLALAAVAVVIGVGIGLYIVRSGPAPVVVRTTVAPPATTPQTPVAPDPTPGPTPAPDPSAPTPKPDEPTSPAPEAKPDPVFNINPKDMLAPLAPPTPTPAVLRPADRSIAAEVKAKIEEKDKAKKEAAKPVASTTPEIVPPPPPPPPDNAYQLIAESPFGAAVKVVSGSGALKLGEAEGMVVSLSYAATPETFRATLDCQPWAIAAINGLSVGKTPINLDLKEAPAKIELRRPGAQPVTLQLAARKPH
ncbi:MAG TPA: protein kinase [Myxococcales bacterium]